MLIRPSVLTVAVCLLVACAPTTKPPAADYGAQVNALADEVWQRALDQSPYLQVRAGRLPRELPDLTPEQAADNAAFSRSILERLDAIPAESLDHQDAITAKMLRWDHQLVLDLEPFYWLGFPYSPYQLGFGFNLIHQQLAAHPFTDLEAHPENYLVLVGEYAQTIEQVEALIRGQMERQIFMSRHALPGVIGTFEAYQAGASKIMRVADERLESMTEDQREAFTTELDHVLSERVEPAFAALLGTLRSPEYQDNAPDAVGLAQYPDGEALYRVLVRYHTTMDISPEELHELGKRRVDELEAEMASIRDEVGFRGDREAFHRKLRTDPQFFAESPEEVEARFNEYIARIEPLVPDYFRLQPRAPYGVQRLAPAAEATMTFGYYQPPTPDEPVGRYHYNGSKLDERPQIWAGPLIYHELVPGHHFHIALQSENEELPMYRREYLAAGAFNEGWGNYGALLAQEMGLLDDPYDRYGAALFDMFISVRLVVDTGMNLLGWTLEEGRDYMRRHTFQSETEIATESLRYSTDLFGQALAYKGGLEKIIELRETARVTAGETWDIRDFHDAVLGSGAMPMVVLEEHIAHHFRQLQASP